MDKLAGDLYNSIKNSNEERVYDMWHASSIAECPRCQYFKRLGVKQLHQPTAGKMLRWKAGHLIEETIRPHLLSVYPDLKSNERIEDEKLQLTGEYDNYSESAKTIFEIKSVHDRAFAYRKKDDGRFHLRDKKAYLHHELQNHCYVKLIKGKGLPVEHITYVYITLDGRIATYQTNVQSYILDEVDRRLKLLNEAWESKTPPECICGIKDHPLWACTMQYCPYCDDNNCSLSLIKEVNNVRIQET